MMNEWMDACKVFVELNNYVISNRLCRLNNVSLYSKFGKPNNYLH